MAFDSFRALLDQFDGLAELHLQGLGEPLMHPRFFDMARLAAQRGIKVSTNTNMTVMTEDQAQACVESGMDTVHVSIDAPTAEAYEAVRLGARLPLVLRNVRRLVAARGAHPGPRIVLVAVLMRSTLEGLPQLVELAAELGVDSMSVQQLCHDFSEQSLPARYQPMRQFVDQEMLGEADGPHVEAVFVAARLRADALGLPLRLPRLAPRRPHGPEVPGRERCDWPWRGAYVCYDGTAMPCCMVATPDRAQMGNMLTDGVAAVWHGKAYANFRAGLGMADPPAVCAGCAIYRGTF
jgi:MoaA/NifB/PqqE/SkfB family radical SAM enzyme